MAKTGPTDSPNAPNVQTKNVTRNVNAFPCPYVGTITLFQVKRERGLIQKMLLPVQEYPVASLHIPPRPNPPDPSQDLTAVQAACENHCKTKTQQDVNF